MLKVCPRSFFVSYNDWMVINQQLLVLCQAGERRTRLDDSHNLHRFLSDYRDLVSWVHDMKTVIQADELAKDVAGAEAFLERHQEHKVSAS